jgi:hypothetical protein
MLALTKNPACQAADNAIIAREIQRGDALGRAYDR